MLKFTDVTLRRGGRVLFASASFAVFPGQKVGITGANGTGKSSLFALLRGELAPSALCWAGRMRYWNAHAQRLRVSPSELWRFAHPLRRPQRMLALYRRLLAM